MERTFAMIKPDAVQRGLVGRVLSRIEEKGLRIVGLKFIHMSKAKAEQLYAIHKERPFFAGLVGFISSSPVVVMVLEGQEAIKIWRTLMGGVANKTSGREAENGSIRGDYGMSKGFNLVHGSDSPESVAKEVPIFFSNDELVAWKPASTEWIYEGPERG
jgi:nucleoside-diphosphate kinase